MNIARSIACALFLSSFAASASAQITVTEPPDISNLPPGPTYTLGVGTNTVSGTVQTPADRQDNFQVTVPAGMTLTAITLTLNTSGGFNGFVTFNSNETLMTSGPFTLGFPYGPGTYPVLVNANFSIGNAWSLSFTVATAAPVCGNGIREGAEACDDGNGTQCDGCSNSCTVVLNGCFIGGVCIADGALDPTNACRACRRGVSRTMYSPVVAGTVCDDGQFCTTTDACNGSGTCTGAIRTCSDGLSCTADACDETADVCVNPVTSGCLIGGACVGGGAVSPSNACLACNPGTSTSAYTPRPAGTSCDDGQFCTAVDACDATGTCGGSARSCSDGLSCTTDACDEVGDRCTNALATGCLIGGACVAGGAVSPANACLACNPGTSTSAYTPRPAGTSCDDGQFCTSVDACDATGTCGGSARSCSDGLSCTTDACDEVGDRCTNALASGCLIGGACVADGAVSPSNACVACTPAASTSAYSPRPTGTACDDGQFCTDVDACDGGGTCGGSARDCTDVLSCTTDSCDEAGDRCTNTLATGCLIGGACVADGAVSPSNACVACTPAASTSAYSPRPVGTSCDDGQFCTDVDACDGAGACGGSARDCSDPLTCTTDACDETADACTNTLAGGCLIGGACIADGTADPGNACLSCQSAVSTTAYSPVALGTSCDDGQFCSTADACDGAGACGGAVRDCSDVLSCTTDACDESADACTNTLATGCLIGGACVADGNVDPSNDCLACDPSTSTSAYSPEASGTICDDGAFCTTDDVCDGSGACAGMARVCSDTDACTTDACDESTTACTFVAISGCTADGGTADGGVGVDGGVTGDAGTGVDGGPGATDGGRRDGGASDGGRTDGSAESDAGGAPITVVGSCGCRATRAAPQTGVLLLASLGLVLAWRRRARSKG